MDTIYHLRIKEEHVVRIIEELIQSDAVEDLDVTGIDVLTDAQKIAVDAELEKIAADENYLLAWDDVKMCMG